MRINNIQQSLLRSIEAFVYIVDAPWLSHPFPVRSVGCCVLVAWPGARIPLHGQEGGVYT